MESRADSAQDDTQGATPSEKITKGVRAILFVLLFTCLAPQGYGVLHFIGVLSDKSQPSPVGEGGSRKADG